MDQWASENQQDVVAQVSDGTFDPQHLKWDRFLEGDQYNQNIREASVFVSHAGMGNIISAREQQTPIIVMNRQFKLGEHRNDHQADGLKWMGKLDGVYTARTQEELYEHLSHIDQLTVADPANKEGKVGNAALTNYIADLIES